MTATNPVVGNSVLQNYLNQQTQEIAANKSAAASAATTSSSSLASATSATSIGSNFNTFINILTTQLQNQDPTNATDPNQFTQELVQFAGVEQQLNTNNDLQSLIGLQTASSLAAGVGYIGNYVEAVSTSDQVQLQGGTTEFNYQLPNAAANVALTVTNSAGVAVASLNGPGASGANYVTWNGQDANGNQLPDGTYTINVAATDASGNAITLSAFTALTKVTGVQSSTTGGLQLDTNGLDVTTSNVTGIFTPNSLPGATALTAVTTS